MFSRRLYSKCGDGFIDSDEDCDCGHKKTCKYFTDINNCCNSKCNFKSSSYDCTDGDCCDKCVISKKICRASIGDCDYPEYCEGYSKKCPFYDHVLPNYDICRKNKGFCYDGNCMNLDFMCKYAYNDSRVFFSTACISLVDEILNTKSKFPNSVAIRKFFENKTKNICSYFVCRVKSQVDIKNAYYFKKENFHCIVQNKDTEKVLSAAPYFMPCYKRGSPNKKYCYKGECKDIINIKNCVNGSCQNFNTRVKMKNIYKENIGYFSASDKIIYENIKNEGRDY